MFKIKSLAILFYLLAPSFSLLEDKQSTLNKKEQTKNNTSRAALTLVLLLLCAGLFFNIYLLYNKSEKERPAIETLKNHEAIAKLNAELIEQKNKQIAQMNKQFSLFDDAKNKLLAENSRIMSENKKLEIANLQAIQIMYKNAKLEKENNQLKLEAALTKCELTDALSLFLTGNLKGEEITSLKSHLKKLKEINKIGCGDEKNRLLFAEFNKINRTFITKINMNYGKLDHQDIIKILATLFVD